MKLASSIIVLVTLAAGCSQNGANRPTDSRATGNTQRMHAQEEAEQPRVERPVVPEALTGIVLEADRIVVTDGPFDDAKQLLESNDEADIVALAKALVVERPQEYFHCMCDGTPAIYVYKGDELAVQVTNHHAQSIRCSLWDSDAPIVSRENWLAWFDKRGIKGPRQEFEQMQARREQRAKDWDKWVAAMPDGLGSVWEESLGASGQVDTSALRAALDSSIPEKREQILALLSWYGSGKGPWSGFPSYESAAESLLLEYDIADIVSAIVLDHMSSNQLEGAARLFGGWSFSRQHPDGLQQVPDTLKAVLWNHVKDTSNKDKLSRAKRAFQ